MSLTANPQRTNVDLTMVLAFHDAFRRDLQLLAALAANSTQSKAPDGWDYFKRQLHVHHTIEDQIIWPAMTGSVTEPEDFVVLDAMRVEHDQLEPALDAVDQSFGTTNGRLQASVGALAQLLNHHLEHEERSALPMISRLVSTDQRAEVVKKIRASVSIKVAPRLLPWLLEGSAPEQERALLATLPPPARLLYRLVWRGRHRRNVYWGAAA
jgi:iron-sulfur cluster repair protein YtfE (RIC family)